MLVQDIERLAREKNMAITTLCKKLGCQSNWHGWKKMGYKPSQNKEKEVRELMALYTTTPALPVKVHPHGFTTLKKILNSDMDSEMKLVIINELYND